MTAVEGQYENGRVELAEKPLGVDRAKVYVTFVVDQSCAADSASRGAIEEGPAFLREGLAVGGPPYPRRNELYDRGAYAWPHLSIRTCSSARTTATRATSTSGRSICWRSSSV